MGAFGSNHSSQWPADDTDHEATESSEKPFDLWSAVHQVCVPLHRRVRDERVLQDSASDFRSVLDQRWMSGSDQVHECTFEIVASETEQAPDRLRENSNEQAYSKHYGSERYQNV